MRKVIIGDQTKEFDNRPPRIIMLGELYLKGKPYTKRNEAVDKEYVDYVFDNITIDNLTGMLQPKNFPSFNMDLINKQGQNNFILKQVVDAAKYHRVKTDDRGRIIGGRTGKFTWEDKDVSSVHWNKFVWNNPKDIASYLPNLKLSDYLMKSRENLIDKKLNINTPNPGSGDTVLNYNQMVQVSENYFTGKIGGLKRDGLDTIEARVSTLDGYLNTGGRPDIYQRSFTKGVNDQVHFGGYRSIDILDKPGAIEGLSTPHAFVHAGYLYVLIITDHNSKVRNPSFRIKLTSSGKLPSKIVRENIGLPHIPYDCRVLLGDDTGYFFTYGNRLHFLTTKGHPEHWHMNNISIDSSGRLGKEWTIQRSGFQTESTISESYLLKMGTSINTGRLMLYNKTNNTWRTLRSIGVTYNANRVTSAEGSWCYYYVGPYVYGLFSDTPRNKKIDNRLVSRLSTINGAPFGIWSYVPVDKDIPNGYTRPITTSDRTWLVTATPERELVISEIRHNANNGLMEEKIHIRGSRVRDPDIPTGRFSHSVSSSSVFVVTPTHIEEFGFRGGLNTYDKYIGFHPSQVD